MIDRRTQYVTAYTERFGREPRSLPEFADLRPCRVPSSPARPLATPEAGR